MAAALPERDSIRGNSASYATYGLAVISTLRVAAANQCFDAGPLHRSICGHTHEPAPQQEDSRKPPGRIPEHAGNGPSLSFSGILPGPLLDRQRDRALSGPQEKAYSISRDGNHLEWPVEPLGRTIADVSLLTFLPGPYAGPHPEWRRG